MTRNYNKSEFYSFYELSEDMQSKILQDYSFELSDALSTNYVISIFKGEKTAVPLCMFLKTNNNFTHGIFSDSYFSGYFLTISKCNTYGLIAYKYF